MHIAGVLSKQTPPTAPNHPQPPHPHANLVHRHAALDARDVAVKGAADGVKVREDVGLGHVKADGDDVARVLAREAARLLDREAAPEELLVVGQLAWLGVGFGGGVWVWG